MKELKCVIVTGLSGAGKTEAIKAFEDMGYFCIDNLPVILVERLEDIVKKKPSDNFKLALVIDARGEDFFEESSGAKLENLKSSGLINDVLFIEASDEALIRRYKESRRPHPLGSSGNIAEALIKERKLLSDMRSSATYIIDTTNLTPRELRFKINDIFHKSEGKSSVIINVESFGYKHGLPIDADLVIDVRFLPNPYYNPKMRNLTGESMEVKKYVLGQSATSEFLRKTFDYLKYLIAQYDKEDRSNITLAIGCTGGKHRSVAIASRIAEFLIDLGYKAYVVHRDINVTDKIADLEY